MNEPTIQPVSEQLRHQRDSGRFVIKDLELPQLNELQEALTPKLTKFIPHQPFPKQAAFLLLPHREAFYGGSAGGGKSDALLMGALQYVDIPGYSAILFRKTHAELKLAGALMFRAKEWLTSYIDSKEVHWSEQDKVFTFPSGATVAFGYLENDRDMYRYQSAEFQYIGFDELTHFKERHYTYLFSRLRRLQGVNIPLRVRSASNPGGTGHDWVKERFLIEGPDEGRIFVPATLDDNIHLDREEYVQSLQELDPVRREQLLNGDWDVRPQGTMFQREWFEIVQDTPAYAAHVRYWDLAATEQSDTNRDPDWTVGVLISMSEGTYFIEDVRRVRKSAAGVEALVKQTAQLDGTGVSIWIEQEPGSAGKSIVSHYQRNVLPQFNVKGDKVTGSKVIRANPLSGAAEAGNVRIVRGSWNKAFLDEIELFPEGNHDDQVDAASGAYNKVGESGISRIEPEGMELLRNARLYS